jgi:hypothetical protein
MELDQLKQALLKLNELHQEAAAMKHVRKGKGQEVERQTEGVEGRLDSRQALIDEVHHEITAIEEQVPEWKIRYYKKRGTYVLLPRITQA